MWKLTIEDDQGNSIPVPLVRDDYSIGRGPENTLRLTERNVSRRHATLVREDERWVLVDLDSYNGSYVNGQRVPGRQVLEDGDLIQLGDYRLKIVEDVNAVVPVAGGDVASEEPTPSFASAAAAEASDASASWSSEQLPARQSGGKKTGLGVAVGFLTAVALGGVAFAFMGSGSEPKVAETTPQGQQVAKAGPTTSQPVAKALEPAPAPAEPAAETAPAAATKPEVEVAETIDLDEPSKLEEAQPAKRETTQASAPPVRVASAPAEKPRTAQPAATSKTSADRRPVLAANPFEDPAPSSKKTATSSQQSSGGNLAALAAQGREGEAKMRPILEQRVARGTASEADIKLLRAICRNMGDRVCADRMTALLAQKN